jgi:hypothetical protein|tara:strand:- start:7207 stop:7776 length:570 start_codon:yes stop_codon:yes gene_type:complete
MLELLSKNHSTWIAMGLSIGIPRHLVEDFVHELYLRFNKYIKDVKKIMYNETEVNKFYVYVTLKNLWTDYSKAKGKHKIIRLDDYEVTYEIVDGESDNYNYAKHSAEEKIIGKIKSEVENWEHWYDRKLFKIYYETDISMRKLAKETNISVTSIFNSCKNYKDMIQSKFGEDFEDYLNGDFHLINNKDE